MDIEKKQDHYLISNDHGSYHISIEEYDSIGKDAALDLAKADIKKKSKAAYFNKSINFDQARELGFCEYGIKDFCSRLELDIDGTYTIKELQELLTLDVLKEYSNECLKLFDKSIIDKFGGVEGILKDCDNSSTFYFITDNFIEYDILDKLSIKAAYYSLKNFEDVYPDDNRPRKAIETKEDYLKGEATEEELSAAESAAYSAAKSAVWSAARNAAYSAAYKYFSEELLKLIKEAE